MASINEFGKAIDHQHWKRLAASELKLPEGVEVTSVQAATVAKRVRLTPMTGACLSGFHP